MQTASTINVECSCEDDFRANKSCQKWKRMHNSPSICIKEMFYKEILWGLSNQHSEATNLASTAHSKEMRMVSQKWN